MTFRFLTESADAAKEEDLVGGLQEALRWDLSITFLESSPLEKHCTPALLLGLGRQGMQDHAGATCSSFVQRKANAVFKIKIPLAN